MAARSAVLCALALGMSTAVALGPAGTASARAVVTPFTFSENETFADAPPECMPVVKSGTTTATDTGAGQTTETANGFAVHFSDLFVYRTQFSDGSYLSGSAVGHHTLIGTTARLVSNEVVLERRTIYAADDTPIGEVTIHALMHTTVNAVTGDVSASVDRFFFTCS
jgi:hypothetical protein